MTRVAVQMVKKRTKASGNRVKAQGWPFAIERLVGSHSGTPALKADNFSKNWSF